ncbi:MAG: cobalt ECF transporter T component CbiQ [Clostridiales bacterium]|nr:MAG: cobalt ECF transporter T component CbiQ [Clostridiales bacterium]
METIESYSYSSPLRLVHPNIKLFAVLLTLVLTIFCYHILVSIIVYLVTTFVAIYLLKVKWSSLIHLMRVPLSFIFLSVITIIVEFGAPATDIVLNFGDIVYISQSGIWRGLTVMLTAMAAANAMYLLALSTPIIDFCEGLAMLKLPKSMVTLMLMIYRLIFVVSEMANKMRIAQTARLGYQTFREGLHSFGVLVSSIFIRSIKRTTKLYNALEARAYNGDIVVLSQDYQMRYQLLAVTILFNGLLFALWMLLWR